MSEILKDGGISWQGQVPAFVGLAVVFRPLLKFLKRNGLLPESSLPRDNLYQSWPQTRSRSCSSAWETSVALPWQRVFSDQ